MKIMIFRIDIPIPIAKYVIKPSITTKMLIDEMDALKSYASSKTSLNTFAFAFPI